VFLPGVLEQLRSSKLSASRGKEFGILGPAPILEEFAVWMFLGIEVCSSNDVSLILLPSINRHGARHHSFQLGSVVLFRKLVDQQALTTKYFSS